MLEKRNEEAGAENKKSRTTNKFASNSTVALSVACCLNRKKHRLAQLKNMNTKHSAPNNPNLAIKA